MLNVMLCSHYPQLKGTTVASTPEQDRLRQLTALNSMVSTTCFYQYIHTYIQIYTHTHTHARLVAVCPGLPRVSLYQKGKTNLDFTEASDSEWQWHQLGHMQVCTSLQTDDHAGTPPLTFLQDAQPTA